MFLISRIVILLKYILSFSYVCITKANLLSGKLKKTFTDKYNVHLFLPAEMHENIRQFYYFYPFCWVKYYCNNNT